MRSPPDVRVPGAGTPGDSTIRLDTDRPLPNGTNRVSQLSRYAAPNVEFHCHGNTACLEVVARVEAGHRAIHELDLPELGHQLLAAARRIAEVHHAENGNDR